MVTVSTAASYTNYQNIITDHLFLFR